VVVVRGVDETTVDVDFTVGDEPAAAGGAD
jgi:hypothetical protein